MNEIIQLIVQKTGISEAHARIAVETALGFIKTKLPGPLASQIDGVLAGGGTPDLASVAGNLAGNLGGMFGKK